MQCGSLIFDLDGTLWDATHPTAQGWKRPAWVFRGYRRGRWRAWLLPAT